jgi:hypothetical protein
VAHDFHNLLTVIRTSVELVAAGPLTDEQRQDLALIAQAERSASELTSKLLMLGRHRPPAFEVADLNDVVSRGLRLLQRVIPPGIRTKFDPAPGLPPVRHDPHQFEQVLMNLALNARDAMPGGGTLAIATDAVVIDDGDPRVRSWARPGRYIRITVTDSGTGMPPAVVARMFEPFFTTKPLGEGTGLGLAVAWSVVQQHGGLVHCRSEVGAGTTFEIFLPLGEEAAAGVARGAAVVARATGGKERILVADDQPLLRPIVGRVLEGAGYSVRAVENGADAVKAAAAEEFALHVLDAAMPVMTGVDAYERIRAARPSARILFMSGFGGEFLPLSFPSVGPIEVLAKPFDAATLLRAVRTALDG